MSYAAVGQSFSDAGVLHPNTNIFTAEAYAILAAVKHIKQLHIPKAVIYTDSLSVVKAVKTLNKHRNPVIISLYSMLSTLYASKQHVVLCWVPGHRQIKGNELADELASSAHAHASNSSVSVPLMDLKPLLKKKLKAHWQCLWDRQTHNKLHVIKPNIEYWPPVAKTRHTQVTLCRLRTGHTYTTHSYLLSGGDQPTCETCGEPLTVLHVLLQCAQLEALRRKHFKMKLGQHLPLHPAMFLGRDPMFKIQSLLAFLKDIHFFHTIFPGDS